MAHLSKRKSAYRFGYMLFWGSVAPAASAFIIMLIAVSTLLDSHTYKSVAYAMIAIFCVSCAVLLIGGVALGGAVAWFKKDVSAMRDNYVHYFWRTYCDAYNGEHVMPYCDAYDDEHAMSGVYSRMLYSGIFKACKKSLAGKDNTGSYCLDHGPWVALSRMSKEESWRDHKVAWFIGQVEKNPELWLCYTLFMLTQERLAGNLSSVGAKSSVGEARVPPQDRFTIDNFAKFWGVRIPNTWSPRWASRYCADGSPLFREIHSWAREIGDYTTDVQSRQYSSEYPAVMRWLHNDINIVSYRTLLEVSSLAGRPALTPLFSTQVTFQDRLPALMPGKISHPIESTVHAMPELTPGRTLHPSNYCAARPNRAYRKVDDCNTVPAAVRPADTTVPKYVVAGYNVAPATAPSAPPLLPSGYNCYYTYMPAPAVTPNEGPPPPYDYANTQAVVPNAAPTVQGAWSVSVGPVGFALGLSYAG